MSSFNSFQLIPVVGLVGQSTGSKHSVAHITASDLIGKYANTMALVSVSEIQRRLKDAGQLATPNPTASIVTANPTSSPTIKVTTDSKDTTTTTTTTTPFTWNPTPTPTFSIFPTSPSAAPSIPSAVPTVPSAAPSNAPSAGPTVSSPRPTVLLQTETTKPTSGPSAFPTNSPSITTTLFVATFQPSNAPSNAPSSGPSSAPSAALTSPLTPATPGPTVGATFVPTSDPTPSPVIYSSSTTATTTSIAGFNKTATTTTTTSSSTTEVKTNTTTLAINTTPGGSATTSTSTSMSPTLFTLTSTTPSNTAPNSTTTYGVTQSTTTTTTKPTTTTLTDPTTSISTSTTSKPSTSTSTTSTTTSVANDGKDITTTTTASLTPTTSPTSSPTPKPSSLPTASAFLHTSKPTNSPTGAPTDSPTYSMGTVPAPTPLTPATTPVAPLTPAPTDSSTTTNFATTPQGTTTVFTTTALPATTGQSTTTFVSTSFVPTTSTTNLSLLAATSNASTSTTKFLGWTNTTATALLPQGTDKATVNVVVKNNNNELSLTSKLVIVSSVLTAAGIALGVGFQLVRWGSRLRDDVMTYRKEALRGQIDLDNEAFILQRGSSYTNRLSYWMVTGKWGSFPNDRNENSLGKVVNEILQINRDAKDAIEALRQTSGGGLAIVPSASSAHVSSAMTQTIGAGMFDLDIPQERSLLAISPVRAFYGAGSSPNLNEYDARRLGIGPPSVQAKEIPLIQTKDIRIVELWSLITKAQQLPYSDQSRTDMLMQALVKYQQIISSGHIYLYDFDTLQDNLMPTLLKELSDLSLIAVDSDPSARLAGAQTLNVGHLPGTRFKWDANFTPSGAPVVIWGGQGSVQLMDTSKPVFSNQPGTINQPLLNKNEGYSKATKSVVLDTQHSQYIASDASEFISIGSDPFATGPTNYNVAGMAGNDIFSISADALGKNSYVNLIGGGGKNTYLIYGKGSWSQLASTIHIWDFDSSKDTIMLVTSDGAINLNETKRTLFSSAYTVGQWNDEQVMLKQNGAKMTSLSAVLANYFHSAGKFKAAEHEFTGEGMPVIVVDETNYSTRNPDSIFSALKTSQHSNSNGQLPLSEVVNTQFGQLNTDGEHQQYKVHLTAGQSYVFTMSHRPYSVGDAVLNTSLTLKDAQNTAVANGKVRNGDSRIDYLALKDGDFYLDASGSLQTIFDDSQKDGYGLGLSKIKLGNKSLSSYEGKYAISAVEIPHIDAFPSSMQNGGYYTNTGNFDGVTNHVGFKMSLSAGDYIDLNFGSNKGFPKLTITNANGDNIKSSVVATDQVNNQIFFAQKSGDYFIDATVDNELVKTSTSYQLKTTKNIDIEGNIGTMADLSIDNVITSNIISKSDHDWFRVQLDALKTYEFEALSKNPSDRLPVHLSLKSYNGLVELNNPRNVVDSIDKAGNFHSKMTWTPVTSDTFYIDVYAATGFKNTPFSGGDYKLSYHII